jgi:TonB family protein
MNGHDRMLDQGQIVSLHGPVPRRSVLLLSVIAHLVGCALIIVSRHTTSIYIVPEKYETAQKISGAAYLSFNPNDSKTTQPRAVLPKRHRRKRQAPVPQREVAGEGGTQVLRAHAKQATAAIMDSIKFRLTYGFSPNSGDKLAVQTAGNLPSISAADLPPRFEQYVIVEVTIDIEGRVADARIVAGMVDESIQQTLLSAVRQFKYSPATRNGAPVPSQRDIVIHVPS